MSQDFTGDKRRKQEPINFDDRRKVPYDYKKGFSPTWQQISVSVITAILIGLLSFLGANYISLNKTVAQHTLELNTIITASPTDQPQIVVNEELRHEINNLTGQLEDVSFDFSELKRNQTSLQRNVDEDFDELDEKLDEMSETLAKIMGHLGL